MSEDCMSGDFMIVIAGTALAIALGVWIVSTMLIR